MSNAQSLPGHLPGPPWSPCQSLTRCICVGRIDASLQLAGSILQPTASGKIALSRGVAVLAAPAAHPEAATAAAATTATPSADRDLVAKAFTALAQKGGITQQLPALDILSQVCCLHA